MGKPEKENLKKQQQEVPKERILIDAEGEERWTYAYTIGNAAKFVGISDKGMRDIIERLKKEGRPVQLYKPQIGRGLMILESDLKSLMKAVPVDD